MNKIEFGEIKSEIRIIGFDDGSFDHESDERVCFVGVVTRGGGHVDGFLVDDVEIDGTDATDIMVEMINGSRHKEQLRIILTSGITFAGFNVLDIEKVFEKTGLPVIVVVREKPDMSSIKSAVRNLSNWKKRWKKLNSAGELIPVEVDNQGNRKSTVYIQVKGIIEKEAKKVVQMSSTISTIPEPLRLAHLLATGISRGESVGRV